MSRSPSGPSRGPARRPDLAQVRLGRRLNGLGQLVEDIGGLVHGAALMPGRRRHLLERLPKAKRAVAGGQFRRDRQATRPQLNQQFAPALDAFPDADLNPSSSFLPSGVAPISTSMHSAG